MIRLAAEAELASLPELERRAGSAFNDLDMADVANGELPTVERLLEYQRDGRAWVLVDDSTPDPIGYAIAEQVDGCGYLEQVSVHPDHGRQGLGRELIEAVVDWTREQSLPALTLTTFVEVPWNRPYYERCGFRTLDDAELTPGLIAIRAAEDEAGLDRWPRCAMRREVQ